MFAKTTLGLLLLLAAAPTLAAPPKTPLTPGRTAAPQDKDEALAAVKAAEDAVKALGPADPKRAEALHTHVDALLTAVAGLEGTNAPLVAELRRAAVEAATEVRTRFPAYPRRAEVLLLEGEALLGMGDRQTAMARWQEVTQDAASPAALDAFVRLGDLYFEAAQMKQAIEAYDGALARSHEGRLARYALYRRAWSRFNLQDYAPALADMQALIEAARAPGADAYLTKLGAEAGTDWAFMYSTIGDPRSAEASVRALFPDTADVQLARLADAYDKTGRFAHAVRIYSGLVDKATMGSIDRLDLRVKLASTALALGEKRSALGKLQDLAKATADLRRAGVDAKAFEPVEKRAEALLRKTTLQWLAEASKTRAPDLRQAAFDLAEAYLAAFPSHRLTPEVHLAYGTALLDAGKVDQALRELSIAAETHPETNARDAARMLMDRARDRIR